MDEAMTLDEAQAVLEGRAAMYGFLSAVYRSEISAETLAQVRAQVSEETGGEEGRGYALLRRFFWETAGEAPGVVEKELAADYAGLFLSVGRTPVPPFESVYTSEGRLIMQRARDEVLALYREEGLGRSDSFKEPEDHIAIELEFMGFLCQKALHALSAGNKEAAQAALEKQKDFLTRHLLVWVPQFCADIERSAATDFYRALAQITDEHLSYEVDAIAELTEAI